MDKTYEIKTFLTIDDDIINWEDFDREATLLGLDECEKKYGFYDNIIFSKDDLKIKIQYSSGKIEFPEIDIKAKDWLERFFKEYGIMKPIKSNYILEEAKKRLGL
jgi:hypothetical protein